jgi:hypothetical protein
MHRPARQQPLPPHWLPVQQACPGLPHTAQTAFWHRVPGPQGLAPGQHDSPGPPQATQVPEPLTPLEVQRVPGSLHEPAQQLCPFAPQAEQ